MSFHRIADSMFFHRNKYLENKGHSPNCGGCHCESECLCHASRRELAGDRAGTGSQQETAAGNGVKGLQLSALRDEVLVFEMLVHK